LIHELALRQLRAFTTISARDWECLLTVFPLSLASFIRRADEVKYDRELVMGQWSIIPPKTHVPTTARGTRLR